MSCQSSPVKNRKNVTKSRVGSARPCNWTLLRMSVAACRTALRASGIRPYAVTNQAATKIAAKVAARTSPVPTATSSVDAPGAPRVSVLPARLYAPSNTSHMTTGVAAKATRIADAPFSDSRGT